MNLNKTSNTDASILHSHRVTKNGFGLVLNETNSYLVFSHQNETKHKQFICLTSKLNKNQEG